MNFNVVNLGCKVNRVEADAIVAQHLSSGDVLSAQSEADVIIVNTCTVTGEADKKARKAVRHALQANSSAKVVVTGCGVEIAPDDFRRIDSRVEVVKRQTIEERQSLENKDPRLMRIGDAFRTRVNLKIQDGCDHRCSYCIVSTARGPSKSIDADELVALSASYAKYGVKELVLTGINLASYDSKGKGLAYLLGEMLEATEHACPSNEIAPRIRISSVEPTDLQLDVIDIMAQSRGRVCAHLHLPLQSGSSKVLEEMSRPYSAEDYLDLVMRMRKAVPRLSLSTDIIVGFPGETDGDFRQTLELARACAFSKIHVFPYSMREGTPAAKRSDQIAPEIKRERALRLRELSDELAFEDFKARIGAVELVLVGPQSALTESYHEIPIPHGARLGALVPTTLTKRLKDKRKD